MPSRTYKKFSCTTSNSPAGRVIRWFEERLLVILREAKNDEGKEGRNLASSP